MNIQTKISVVAFLLSLCAATAAAQTGDLVWQSDLDGNANDNVGGYHFQANNAPTATVDRFGNAAGATNFNGTNQQFTSVGVQPVTSFTSGSVSIWARGSTTGGDDGAIFVGGNAGGIDQYFGLLRAGSGSGPYRADVDNGATRVDAQEQNAPTPIVNTTSWNLVTMTWEGNATGNFIRLYVNGVLEQADVVGYNTVTPNKAWRVGAYDTANLFWGGQLDDAAIWDAALDHTEVLAMYNLTSDSALQYNAQDADALIGLFRAGSGTTTIDGTVWEYASGLGLNQAGALIDLGDGRFGLILDALGNGVQQAQAVPEPASVALWSVLGLAFCAFVVRRRNRHVR